MGNDLQEYPIDLHIHTPIFRDDYLQPNIETLDILEEAKKSDLKMVAITDHNSIIGYRRMIEEFENLRFLGTSLKEAGLPFDSTPEIKSKKDKYDRYQKLLFSNEFLILPGVEITVNGIHILGIFERGNDIESSFRIIDKINAMLIEIGIKPDEQNVFGYSRKGIVEVCEAIKELGGLVIAAHTLSKDGLHGKIEKGRELQDIVKSFMALEVKNYKEWKEISELHSGQRQGYPFLPCIMSSDAHFIKRDESNPSHKDRVTFEDKRITRVLMQTLSFNELRQTFLNETLKSDRIQIGGDDLKYFKSFIENYQNNTLFSSNIPENEDKRLELTKYICAYANSFDGEIFIGVELLRDNKNYPKFTDIDIENAISKLKDLIRNAISPTPQVEFSPLKIDRHNILRINIAKCKEQRPYVLRETGSVWLFDNNGELNPASHADLVDFIRPVFEEEFLNMFEKEKEDAVIKYKQEIDIIKNENGLLLSERSKLETEVEKLNKLLLEKEEELSIANRTIEKIPLPNTGIEVIESKLETGKWIHSLLDLRNHKIYHNRTWENTTGIHHYAIAEHENFLLKGEVAYKAIESRIIPGIWIYENFHAEQWKYNIYDMRGSKKKVYYSVVGDLLEGSWQEIIQECHSRNGENQVNLL